MSSALELATLPLVPAGTDAFAVETTGSHARFDSLMYFHKCIELACNKIQSPTFYPFFFTFCMES